MSTGKKILIAGMASGATLIVAYILYQKYWAPATVTTTTAATPAVDPATGAVIPVNSSVTPTAGAFQRFTPGLPTTTVSNAPMATVTPPPGIATGNGAAVVPSLKTPASASTSTIFKRLLAARTATS